jgi:hypothetical protein
MNKVSNSVSFVLLAAAFALPVTGGMILITAAHAESQDASDQLVGVWEGDGPSDSSAQQHTILELRADHTYTKTLNATVNGAHYGGTHSGTWTARGMIVDLSGDGNYPAYSQNLHSMRKVK